MKKYLTLLMLPVLVAMLNTRAFAAGGGPPKGIIKGVITKINLAEKTVEFKRDGQESVELLPLTDAVDITKIELNKKVLVSMEKKNGNRQIKEVSKMFMNLTMEKFISLLVIGLIGGLLSGFIGSGGAFVLTPAMMSLGAPGAVAVASNMCHKFPKAMVGAYKRWKYGQADIKLGLVMAGSAIVGVQIGIRIQKIILATWGNAGSNLYVSVIFVVILLLVGAYVFYDAYKLSKGGIENKVSKLALFVQKINIPPMMHFKVANVTVSAWVTIPIGLMTGMLAATIAVGGFIGVPGMIYVVGASATVASATELIIAFVMGAWGSIQWGLSGLIDIRLTLLILATSLVGVQIGALGTTYVKDYLIKIVMGGVMLIIAVSRGAKIPGYMSDLKLIPAPGAFLATVLESISFWTLVLALGSAGIIISVAIIKGMMQAKAETSAQKVTNPA
jgi:hypothetical protein